jgi:hypothetical protein
MFMKKVFLLFGVAAFSSASAQQKDLFDVNRHIQGLLNYNKITEKSITPLEINTYFLNGSQTPGVNLFSILPNGAKVYLLPQDNMPCVLPGITQNNMPNISNPDKYFEALALTNNTPGSIPNAVKPYKLIASK